MAFEAHPWYLDGGGAGVSDFFVLRSLWTAPYLYSKIMRDIFMSRYIEVQLNSYILCHTKLINFVTKVQISWFLTKKFWKPFKEKKIESISTTSLFFLVTKSRILNFRHGIDEFHVTQNVWVQFGSLCNVTWKCPSYRFIRHIMRPYYSSIKKSRFLTSHW